MARKGRNWHKDFEDYMKYIVAHPNYAGIKDKHKEDGSIRWVVSGNSELGKERDTWWLNKVAELGVKTKSDVARAVHPKELNGLKPCQICGKKLSINYVYPNANTIKRLLKATNIEFLPFELTVDEIFDELTSEYGVDQSINLFKQVFNIKKVPFSNKSELLEYIRSSCLSKLSPGVMSNAPDRFEGFHTYNACCRSKEDTGRHKSNLARYSQDRRAYENWADGDFNLANRIMGEFSKYKDKVPCPECKNVRKMSADHIGPISLGFTHSKHFKPLCSPCNSGKNNRMNLEDIKQLISLEESGETVISRHTRHIWNLLKDKVSNDQEALNLSEIMRKNMHNVLIIFSKISENGYNDFLQKNFLNPEYAYVDFTFNNFSPLDLGKLEINQKPLESKNKVKNSERYVRISFEALDDYKSKENRRAQEVFTSKMEASFTMLMSSLEKGDNEEALRHLDATLLHLAQSLANDFKAS